MGRATSRTEPQRERERRERARRHELDRHAQLRPRGVVAEAAQLSRRRDHSGSSPWTTAYFGPSAAPSSSAGGEVADVGRRLQIESEDVEQREPGVRERALDLADQAAFPTTGWNGRFGER